jgi:ApbE superfamily uncharacterized protein (UPF0280 family)
MPKKMRDQLREGAKRRLYRQRVRSSLQAECITVQETDLTIYSDMSSDMSNPGAARDLTLAARAKESIIRERGYIESYIHQHPQFAKALSPLPDDPLAPAIISKMISAGQSAGVGPMAAVAGAIAEEVGRDLLDQADQVIVENGGDIFVHVHDAFTTAIYAGPSPLSMKVGIRIQPDGKPTAICTSSATVGHSLSLGCTDAACIIGRSCALADAMATALGNRITGQKDIQPAIDWANHVPGVDGILVILGENMGAWGNLEVVPI